MRAKLMNYFDTAIGYRIDHTKQLRALIKDDVSNTLKQGNTDLGHMIYHLSHKDYVQNYHRENMITQDLISTLKGILCTWSLFVDENVYTLKILCCDKVLELIKKAVSDSTYTVIKIVWGIDVSTAERLYKTKEILEAMGYIHHASDLEQVIHGCSSIRFSNNRKDNLKFNSM